tara:strand:- start:6816 stop:7376 length:561 start_codon:yes stop_codon:yes gene_type:complete
VIVAQQKKKENIIEYILYMWNVEDLLRSLNLEIASVDSRIIKAYPVDDEVKKTIREWYVGLIKEMKTFGLLQKGHLPEVNELIAELAMLHDSLLHLYQDPRYIELERHANENLKELIQKSGSKSITAVEAGLNGLYGVLLLRMKKKMISKETEESIRTISDLFALLAVKYKDMKNGNLSFPSERKN